LSVCEQRNAAFVRVVLEGKEGRGEVVRSEFCGRRCGETAEVMVGGLRQHI